MFCVMIGCTPVVIKKHSCKESVHLDLLVYMSLGKKQDKTNSTVHGADEVIRKQFHGKFTNNF